MVGRFRSPAPVAIPRLDNIGINQTVALSNTGAGSITLNGTGGGTGSNEAGYFTNANVTAVTGNISITSAASATTAGSVTGLNLSAVTVSTGGSGTITLRGTAAGSGSFTSGVALNNGAQVLGVGGLISVTGINNSSGGGSGVSINGTNSTIDFSGSGGVTVIGTGGGSGTSRNNYGVSWSVAGGIQSTGGGAITITGTGGDSLGTLAADTGGNNYGVFITQALSGSGGAISITGTGGNSSGSNNYRHRPDCRAHQFRCWQHHPEWHRRRDRHRRRRAISQVRMSRRHAAQYLDYRPPARQPRVRSRELISRP